MKKYLFLAIICCIQSAAFSQVKVNVGRAADFSFKKLSYFSSHSAGNYSYFLFPSNDMAAPQPMLLSLDKDGNVLTSRPLKLDVGSFSNSFEVNAVRPLGENLIALIENRDFKSNLNKLSLRVVVDEEGRLEEKQVIVGALEYKKMMQPGNWFSAVSPDKKHLAIVGQLPHDKDAPNRYKYFFYDEKLNLLNSGELSFPNDTKKIHFENFYASDKGDFYLVSPVIEKGFTYPLIYKSSVSENKGTVIPVQFSDPSDKIMSFTTIVNERGDLVLAGYAKKKLFAYTDVEATGSWMYNTADGKLKINTFQKPVKNLTALGIVTNGNTMFLVGEQVKKEQQPRTQQQAMNFEENYKYQHNDIYVTAFDADGAFKFETNMPRNWTGYNVNTDLSPAFGVINGKLAVVYNDQYGKYFPNTSYDNYKLPVLVNITNDGLMEPAIPLQKELDVLRWNYVLQPRYFAVSNNRLVVIASNSNEVKGVVFY